MRSLRLNARRVFYRPTRKEGVQLFTLTLLLVAAALWLSRYQQMKQQVWPQTSTVAVLPAAAPHLVASNLP